MMKLLLKAGANPNNHGFEGATPMFFGRDQGAASNESYPRLIRTMPSFQVTPSRLAAKHGHSSVVRELIRQGVSEGGEGPSGGVQALQLTAKSRNMDNITFLTDAGVVDTGAALFFAARHGQEASVAFLLHRYAKKATYDTSYVTSRGPLGENTLVAAINLRPLHGCKVCAVAC